MLSGQEILSLAARGELWPDGRRFAFTVFDDPDSQTTAVGREIYSFLYDLGILTTRGCWPAPTVREPSDIGENCSNPLHLEWLLQLQSQGFELGLHNVTNHTSFRQETIDGLDRFRQLFGADPVTMSNHFANDEGIYFGDARLSGIRRLPYRLANIVMKRRRFYGEQQGHPLFWGDYCEKRIQYVRNFVFTNINTLVQCPLMPYFDAARPLVRGWYSSAEGSNATWFLRTVTPQALDRLEEQGGCCIMYTHFAKGFWEHGALNPSFRAVMQQLSKRNGWFVPVGTLLDHLKQRRGGIHPLTAAERSSLEFRWMFDKLRVGSH